MSGVSYCVSFFEGYVDCKEFCSEFKNFRVIIDIDDFMNFLELGYEGLKLFVFCILLLLMLFEFLFDLVYNLIWVCERYIEMVYFLRLVWDGELWCCVK